MSQTRDETWRTLRQHLPDSEIAAAFGVSRQAIHSALGARPKSTTAPAEHATTVWEWKSSADLLPGAMYAWRTRRNLTQSEAAARVHIISTTWSIWERRMRPCRLAATFLLLLDSLDKIDALIAKGK